MYSPDSVLDVGCGTGHYLQLFKYLGANNVMGIDGIAESHTILNKNEYISMDLSDNFNLNKNFDLVLCLEILEHLSYDSSLRTIKNLTDHATKRIVFSAAEPDQPGIGHINCQPIEFWIEKFADLGWEVNEFDTISIRMMSTFTWFKRNLLVLHKVEDREVYYSQLIHAIGKKEIVWDNISPDIISYPFQSQINEDNNALMKEKMFSILFSQDYNIYEESMLSYPYQNGDRLNWIQHLPFLFLLVK